MGDACSICLGYGKIGGKLPAGNGPERPCWACRGTGMVQASKDRAQRDRDGR